MNNSKFKYMNRILFTTSILTLFFTTNIIAQSTTNPDTVCAGSNMYYKIPSATVNSTFTWGIKGSGGILTFGQSTDSIRVAWTNTAGSDTLWVVETNAAGCKGDTTKLTVIRVAPPTAEFDNSTLCYGETLKINFTGYPPYNVQYTLNGNPVNQSGITQNPYSVGGIAGNYILVQISDKNCINNTLSGQINAVIGAPLNTLQIQHD